MQTGDGQIVIGTVNPARRFTPGIAKLGLHYLRKSLKPPVVISGGYVAHRQPQLLFGEGIHVVAAPFDDPVDQLVTGFGYVLNLVPSIFHGI